jgi:pimeloyl-ACP methyl ester carboxylesterase
MFLHSGRIARTEIIPDAGHLPQIEQPSRMGTILMKFLSEKHSFAT